MQLGDPTVLETSYGEAVAENDGVNGGSEEKGIIRNDSGDGHGDESHEKMNGGGNRWPRQETLALLKIRLDMDAVFRDSSLKGPLWEDVSRKLADLGYHRSPKKCKEKFENVYKYHKRTKESRSGKSEGKTYRFFDQLQALEKQFNVSSYPPKPQPTLSTTNNNISTDTITSIPFISTTTVPSTNPTIISPPPLPPSQTNATTNVTCTATTTTVVTNPSNDNNNNVSYSLPITNLFSTTSSTSSTASDEDLEEKYRKKRKWKDYFRRLTRQVLAKQEEMQKKFLEVIDTRKKEHVTQQDAWRMQQMARINREHELLVQERTTAAAKDAAIVKFLQKLSGEHNLTIQLVDQTTSAKITPTSSLSLSPQPSLPPVSQVLQPQPQQKHMHQLPLMVINNNVEIQKMNNGHSNGGPLKSSSRWPKAEVQALIKLRTSLDAKYQENAPKAPLWEDISAGMQRLGYNRSAKRCKEKWENINKYFKKVKESSKKRREDSKTCPYFEELEALYQEKRKTQNPFGGVASGFKNMKQNEMMEPLMVQPEQQWRPPSENELNENNGRQKRERGDAEEGDSMEDDKDDGEEDGDSMEEDEEGDNSYEITTNKLSSVDTVE